LKKVAKLLPYVLIWPILVFEDHATLHCYRAFHKTLFSDDQIHSFLNQKLQFSVWEIRFPKISPFIIITMPTNQESNCLRFKWSKFISLFLACSSDQGVNQSGKPKITLEFCIRFLVDFHTFKSLKSMLWKQFGVGESNNEIHYFVLQHY